MSGPGNNRVYTRRDRTPLAPVTLAPGKVPESLAAAYSAVGALVRATPERWTGWKLGGTNHASRAAFNVTDLYYGAIEAGEILHQPTRAPGYAMAETKGEVEIALRVGAGATGYDGWCVALEMPSSPITNLLDAGVCALVADRCAAGALILGDIHEGPLPDLSGAELVLMQDAQVLDRAGLDRLTDPPEALLAAFLDMAACHGMPVKPGDWVATGGITTCPALRPGATVSVQLDGRQALTFGLDTGAPEYAP